MFDYAAQFGRFELSKARRRLERQGEEINIGSRAMDILILLVDRAGEVVPYEEIFARVWPRCVVEPGNLRVHIAALRKALGDGTGEHRYIETIPLRGYSLVVPVHRVRIGEPAPEGSRSRIHVALVAMAASS